MIRSAAFIVAMAATVVPAIAASQTSDGSHGSAPRLIACAQAALGGRKVLRNVRGIRLRGQFHAPRGRGGAQPGEREIAFILPDRYRELTQSHSVASDGSVVSLPAVVIGINRGGLVTAPGARQPPGDAVAAAALSQAEFERVVALLLIREVPGSSTILDGGGSDTDRSAGSHMTIRVHHTAPNRPPGDDFSLELDPASCTPARLVWQRPATLSDLVREQGSLRPEDRVPLSQLAARLAASSGTRSESIELSGYRSASGLQIPFVWSRAVDGRIIEQWQVDDVEINPHLEPNYFATTSTN